MMDSQIRQYLLWTFIVNYMLVQAEIGDVHVGLHEQIYKCVCNSNGLHECLNQQTLCLRSSIFRCLRFHEPLKSYHSHIGTLCGVINTGRQLTSHIWDITVHSTFSVHIEFIHFHLPATPHCASGTRAIVGITYTYCGHRMPWNISIPLPHATVECNTEYYTPRGFHFVMIFQAFDRQQPSVASIQQRYEYDNYFDTGIFTLWYLAIGQEHRFMEKETRIHITVSVHKKIELKLQSPIPMRIYDGPGILSPVILPEPNATHVQLSHYQGFVTYSVQAHNPSSIYAQIFKWFSKVVFTQGCKGSPLKGTYVMCDLIVGIASIHKMLFSGYTMLSHSVSSIYSGCQYGGLFIIQASYFFGHYEYFKVCSNITEEISFPIHRARFAYRLIFITFHGYSSGFIDLILSRDEACSGENIAISRGPSNINSRSTWEDPNFSPPSVSGFIGMTTNCADVWLLNNIGVAETSPFKYWYFDLDHSELAFPVGPFKIIISTMFIIQPSFNNMVMDISSLGYIKVEIDVVKDFPIHATTEKGNFSLPLLTQHIDTFNSSIFTTFHVSYSGSDRFPIFAIRVQFIEHVICLGNTNMVTTLYPTTVLIEDVLNVYLPRNHPLKQLLHDLLDKDGYNRGTCRAIISGHKCSQSISHYQIVRIHYQPHKSLVVPHEIDISMKKTVNCSVECSLDIGILEYMHINVTRRFRYHEWRRIYRLTWQVISAVSRGFLVTINSTCNACAKLCDIAVALGIPLTSNHMFKPQGWWTRPTWYNDTPAFAFPLLGANGGVSTLGLNPTATQAKNLDFLDDYLYNKFFHSYNVLEDGINNLQKLKHGVTSSDHMYGNWYDANAYCSARNSSLVTHAPGFFHYLTDQTDSVDYGWDKSQEINFAGFHRDGLVSGSI